MGQARADGGASSPAPRPASARASPTAFAAEGADVVVADLVDGGGGRRRARRRSPARRPRGAVRARPTSATRRSVRAHGRRRRRRLGRVDILVNNAGIFTESLLEDMPVEDWDRVVGTSTCAARSCAPASLIGQMLERRDGDHQHRLPARADRRRGGRPLLGQQGRRHRVHQGAGARGGHAGRPRQRHRARPDPDAAAGRRDARSGAAPSSPSCRSAASARSPRSTPTAVLLASADGSYYVGQTLGAQRRRRDALEPGYHRALARGDHDDWTSPEVVAAARARTCGWSASSTATSAGWPGPRRSTSTSSRTSWSRAWA